MDYKDLVSGFAARYGVQDAVVEDGVCTLEIDGMNIALINSEESDMVTVYGEIGLPPPDANGRFGGLMLQANHLLAKAGGAILCQNPENGAYAIFQSFPLAQMDVEAFSSKVEAVVNKTESWRQIVAGYREAEAVKPADGNDGFDSIPENGFMQV